MKICGKRGKWNKTLDFLKMIFYFLNSKSTTWGIYREYIYMYIYIGGSLSKSMRLAKNKINVVKITSPCCC